MKKIVSIILAVIILSSSLVLFAGASGEGYLIITDFVEANSGKDVSTEIQAVIEANPNRTIFFQ